MAEKSKIEIAPVITVGDFAEKIDQPISKVISELMRSGMMVTVNENIDFDIAQIIIDEMELQIELVAANEADIENVSKKNAERASSDSATIRPPIIAVMGHVDHGKTSLLDAIRKTDVAEGEAGGITQHISAYQIAHGERKITFLDTPGHEAFAAIREHGAQLTDVALIVVAADDGIKPQTTEAIKFASKAGVKIVVAINKMDKPEADVNRIKQQLTDAGLQPEDWGGSIVVVEVSAKTGDGVDKLLDMILLVADIEELKAEDTGKAEGLIIEANLQQGRGSVATLLIEHGEVKPGQFIVAGGAYGKIRTLENDLGTNIAKAGPATPVVISGFKSMPRFGDKFYVADSEKEARTLAEQEGTGSSRFSGVSVQSGSEMLSFINKKTGVTELPVIVKADVQGSLKSVIDALKSLNTPEVAVRVIGNGIGAISENDVTTAAASDAVIYGFNVEVPSHLNKQASRDGVVIGLYKIIYELIDDARARLSDLLEDEVIETETGELVIKGVFRTTQKLVICGGEVISGLISAGSEVTVMRGEEEIATAKVIKVQKEQSEAKEAKEGELCGLELETDGKLNLKEGDTLKIVKKEVRERSL